MKHKGLLATIAIIALATIVALVMKETGPKQGVSEKKTVTIGILQFVTHEALDEINRGIVDGLEEAGYSGSTVKITQMNAEADQSKIQTMSQQLVSSNDIVIGIATPAAQGLANATTDIPVVMGAISDPVGAKLVTNLEQPEANVTGTSNQIPIRQSVELIRRLTPQVKKVGVVYASSEDNSVSQVAEFKTIAAKEGLEVVEYAVPSTNEIAATMSVAVGNVDALFVPQDNTIASAFPIVVDAAKVANIPVYSSVDTMVAQGSLAAIAQSQYGLGQETAKVVVKLLAGQEVKDVPVNIVDTGTPIINRQVADELGITLPKDLEEQADMIATEKETP